MNWIVTLTRNNLALTRAAIESFRAQDITTFKNHVLSGVRILVVDNDSTDSTRAWLATQRDLYTIMNTPQQGVAAAWNQALKWVFSAQSGNAEYALVCNNDVVLRPDSYRWLVNDGGGFVTCVGSDDKSKIDPPYEPPTDVKRPHPDFSCFLIRRWVYERVGSFNVEFAGAYCEDSDYHLRMHRKGVKAECLDLPFHHIGAATINNASEKERSRIAKQADKNRELFKRLYGFGVGSEEYYKAFGHGSPEEVRTV